MRANMAKESLQKSVPAAIIIQRWWHMAKDRRRFNQYMRLRGNIRTNLVRKYFATWGSHCIAVSHFQRTIIKKCFKAWKVRIYNVVNVRIINSKK
jgi:hypothetical protein